MKFNRANGIRTIELNETGTFNPLLTRRSGKSTASFGGPTFEPITGPEVTAPSTTFITANVAVNSGITSTFKAANTMAQFLPTGASTVKRLGTGYVYANGGGFYADGVYYTTYYTTNSSTGNVSAVYNRTYNATTWAQTKSTSVMSKKGLSTVALAVSYDVVTEKAYGCFYKQDGSALTFASIDKSFNVTPITDINKYWLAAAFDGKGKLYAIDGDGNLFNVSVTDGAMTKIGNTGLASGYYTSGAIDPRTGTFYFAYINENAGKPTGTTLYTIDTATAKATKLYDFEGLAQLYGMFVAPPATEDNAPAAVSNITFDFKGTSLAGKVNFDAPTLNYAGEPASGDLSFVIKCGKDTVATGNTAYGAKASADVEFPTAGKKTVTVTVKSDAGESPAFSATSQYIGPDAPKPATGLKIVNNDGKIQLSWTPVTATKNNGYIDPESVKYIVSLTAPEKKVIADSISATSCEYVPEDPTVFKTYSFQVKAIANGLASTNVSGSITIGRITPPYSNNFLTSSSLNGYTVIDANADKTTWGYYGSSARLVYQNKRASDDYLITPALNLEGGKIYTISLDAKGWDTKSIEKFRIVMGKTPTAEGMDTQIGDTVTFIGDEYKNYIFEAKADQSGVYYFGIHGISPNIDSNGYLISQAIYIKNIKISAPIDLKAPLAPALSIEAEKYGKLQALVKVTAPSKDNNGNNIAALDSIVVKRGGKTVHTFTSVAPGQDYTWTDESPVAGNNTYEAYAYNSFGASPAVSAMKFIGHTLPLHSSGVSVSEEGTTGKVTLKWNPVTQDENGLLYNEGDVTYTIYAKDGKTAVASGLKDTTYTFQALEEGKTDFVIYYIATVTEKGKSALYAASDIIPVGPAYTLPYFETYKGGKLYSPLGFEVSQNNMATVSLATDATLASYGVSAFDADNGYLNTRFYTLNIQMMIYTAKIDLTKAQNPAFQVATYAFLSSKTNKPAINRINLIVRPLGESKWTSVKSWTSDDMEATGWATLNASLNEFKGKNVQVGLLITCTGMTYTPIDAMKVYEMPDYELEAASISAPESFIPNVSQDVVVEVKNNGNKAPESYDVELFLNGKSYAKAEGPALASGAATKVKFPVSFSPVDRLDLEFHAVVNFDKDDIPGNNKTGKATSHLVLPDLPAVEDLAAKESVAAKADLYWSAPLDPKTGDKITDSFENYKAFDVDKAGEWSFYDGDKLLSYAIEGVTLPGIPYTGSYVVLNSGQQGLNASFDGKTGKQSLACFSNNTKNDDWAISPELSGLAQTISFYARSYASDLIEKFEFYYSKTGKNPSDFIKVNVNSVPAEWTEYSFDLPAGARYFAIRDVSEDCFILLIDDVTYMPKGAQTTPLSIDGFNLYRDAVKLNTNLLTVPSFIDDKAEKGDHKYQVTVVYKDKGESKPSNTVKVTIDPSSAIDAINAGGINVYAVEGGILISGVSDDMAAVFTTDARLVANVALTGETRVALEAGIYVVKIGKNVTKVMVM